MVVDAGVLVEALAMEQSKGPIGQRLSTATVLDAPTHIGVEFVNAIRRLVLDRKLATERAEEALNDYLALPIQQHRLEALGHRVWDLHHNLTAYDAAYIAVAENLDQDLYTMDANLKAVPNLRCRVVVL